MAKVDFQHPDYQSKLPQWDIINDCLEGQDKVKKMGEKYLPCPGKSGSKINDDPEVKERYADYKLRAVFYPVTSQTRANLIGDIFRKDPVIEIKNADLQPLIEDVTGSGVSLNQFCKDAFKEVLSFGRCGILADFPEVPQGTVVTRGDIESGRFRPSLNLYDKYSIINWRTTTKGGESYLSLLVLEECIYDDTDDFELKSKKQWREFRFVEDGGLEKLRVRVYEKGKPSESDPDGFIVTQETFPKDKSQNPLSRIPFQFIGSWDNTPEPDEPPLYNLAALNIAHYRNSADTEESSFIHSQPTLKVVGINEHWYNEVLKGKLLLRARAGLPLPVGADADLIQMQANTMSRELMKDKEEQMKAIGARLVEPGRVQQTATQSFFEESAELSTVQRIANNVSEAIRYALRDASLYITDEASPDDITLRIESDTRLASITAQDRQVLLQEYQQNLLAWEEYRGILKAAGFASAQYDKSAQDEEKRVQEALAKTIS